jgi:hypothetical protein
MKTKNNKIDFFCPKDKVVENLTVNSPLICKTGNLILDAFPPHQSALFYCRICAAFLTTQTFFEYQPGLCPSCGKKIREYNLCNGCLTIELDNPELLASRNKSKEANPNRECPVCSIETDHSLSIEHICKILKITLKISRDRCPFCQTVFSVNEKMLEMLRTLSFTVNRHELFNENSSNQINEMHAKLLAIQELPLKLINLEETFVTLQNSITSLEERFSEEAAKNENENEQINGKLTRIEHNFAISRKISNARVDVLCGFFATVQSEFLRHFNELNSILETIGEKFHEDIIQPETLETQTIEPDYVSIVEEADTELQPTLATTFPETDIQPSITKYMPDAYGDEDDFPTVVNENVQLFLSQIDDQNTPAPTGFVGKIFEQFPNLEALCHYPLIEGALKAITSQSDTVVFYRLQIGKKNFAIPAFPNVQNENQFKQYSGLYRAATTHLNGRIAILEAAELEWNIEIKGYKCKKKGLISIL